MKKQTLISHPILLLVLLVLIAVGVIPSYLSNQWSWQNVPDIPNLRPVAVNLRKTGLNLTGWQTVEQAEITLSENQWSAQFIERTDAPPVTLLLMPQDFDRNKPQVEWADLNSFERWKTDSHRKLIFSSLSNPTSSINACFFRAWRQKTYAVIQWYAWSDGGDCSPKNWFWLDQKAQLQGKKVPWVAVSIHIQINPLSELETMQPFAKMMAQTVQTTLEQQFFEHLK